MEEQNKTDPDDFSEEFLPLWRSYRKYQNILIVFAVIVLGCVFLKMTSPKAMWIWIIPAIVWNIYFYFKLRCPKCDGLLLFGDSLLIGRHCPNCGAILKKKGLNYPIHPWIPWQDKTSREKTIIVAILTAMVMLMVLAIVVGIIRGGGIKYQHYDVSKSQCR